MTIAERLATVRSRINDAVRACGRDSRDVHLIAVSKKHPKEAIAEAYAAGQRAFGENYAQEFAAKAEALADLVGIEWHFIGHLQTNKVKLLTRCQVVHTVDSLRIAEVLAKRARGNSMRAFVEVNLGGETSKSGCPKESVAAIVDYLRGAPGLSFAGLMTMPPPGDLRRASEIFARLQQLARAIQGPKETIELSIGMSEDLEVAIAHGATHVRVGTAIFGLR